MRFLKILCAIAISIGLGAVFIYSGYSKLYPLVEPFEFTFVEIGIANWFVAPLMARALIGLEFFIGLLLIANYRLKKFTIPLAISILLFFILYLLGQIIVSGNQGNCGCFGEHLRMTPFEAIVKNVIMIVGALTVGLLFEGWNVRLNKLLLAVTAAIALSFPFMINPVDYSYTSNNLDEKINYPLELELLYESRDTAKVEIPSVDLRQGKHVVAFLSLTCSHCRIAAKKFRLIKKNNPSLPIYFILNGDKSNYADFIEDTHAGNIPSSFCLGKSFIQLASAHLPRIYYLDNGIVKKKIDYFELSQYHIEEWLSTGKIN